VKLPLSFALAILAGGLAIGAQWWIAGPVENGWFCTGRLGCWLWTKASFPAYAIAVTIADNPDSSSGFLPMAIGTFVQWFVVVLAVTQLPRVLRA
jgi:hypothetical protein